MGTEVGERRDPVPDPVTGELVDPVTAEVIDEHPIVFTMPEWRAYDAEQWMRRARTTDIDLSEHDFGLHTDVEIVLEKPESRRLKDLNDSIRVDKKEMKLVTLLNYVRRYAKHLELPAEVAKTAALWARRVAGSRRVTRRLLHVAALILVVEAAKYHGYPVSLWETVTRLELDEDTVRYVMRRVWPYLPPIMPKVSTYIDRAVNSLNLPPEVALLANSIVAAAGRRSSPLTAAAAAVYVAALLLGYDVTEEMVARAVGVTEGGLRHNVKHILSNINIVVNL